MRVTRDALGRWRLAKEGSVHLTKYISRVHAEAAKHKIESGLVRWIPSTIVETFKNPQL